MILLWVLILVILIQVLTIPQLDSRRPTIGGFYHASDGR